MTDQGLKARAEAGDPAAQYALAAALARAGASAEAGAWLERAAAARHPGALYTLATRLLAAPASAAAAERAAELLGAAAAEGGGAASRQLAVLKALGLGLPRDPEGAVALVAGAAAAGRPDALRELSVLAALNGGPGASPAAARGLAAAAAGGDGVARALLPLAPASAPEAAGLGGPAIDALAKAAAPAPRPPPAAEIVRAAAPRIAIFRGALPPLAAAYVAAAAAPLLAPSAVVDSAASAARLESFRSSDGCAIEILALDLVLVAIWERLALIAGRKAAHCELMQVLRYRPGQEYRPHHDYLPDDAGDYSQVRRAGQREATLLTALNEGYGGGATAFPRLGAAFRLGRGDSLLFENVGADGAPIEASLHAGEKVLSGEKWMLTLWFRQRRFWFWP